VPTARPATGAAGGAAEKDRLPLGPKDFSLEDRLIATEQAIQLDELIKWVKAQAGVESPEARSGPSPSP